MPRITQEEWDDRAAQRGFEWIEPVGGADVLTRARCRTCKHEWVYRPASWKKGSGCPACSLIRVANTHRLPQAVWDERAASMGITWLEPVTRSNAPTRARCQCGHEWKPRPGNVSNGFGCPKCGYVKAGMNQRVSQAVWDERALKCGFVWLKPVGLSGDPTPAKCLTCGHEWRSNPVGVHRGSGCPKCGIEKSVSHKRIPQEVWDRRAAKCGYEWTGPVTNASKKAPARCLTCGHEWEIMPSTWKRAVGCPNCAEYGFHPLKPAVVYLLSREMDQVAKIGISGAGRTMERRMERHRQDKWDLVRTWNFEVGRQAFRIEQAVLRVWRDEMGLPPAVAPGQLGWSETVDTATMQVPQIIELVNRLVDEQKRAQTP